MADPETALAPELLSPELRERLGRIAPMVLAAEQVLPVPDVFEPLLPGTGLQRGWITRVEGDPSARALAWAMLGEVTTSGGWIAAVNISGISLAAAREVGVAIERVLVVTSPNDSTWSATVGALIGSVDVVMFGTPQRRVAPSEHRRMASRARERGSVLMELATSSTTSTTTRGRYSSQLEYDISFVARPVEWEGLGEGHGCLRSRALDVEVSGRRIGGGSRQAQFELPAVDGMLRRRERRATVTALPV